MLFKYLQSANNTMVFALSTDISQVLRIRKVVRTPSALAGIAVHEDSITRNWKTHLEQCANSCGVTVDEKVQVIFSGPIISKAAKIARLEEILTIMKSDEGQAILDGFPAGPNSHFELLDGV